MPVVSVYNAVYKVIESKASGLVTMKEIKASLEEIVVLSLENDCYLWLNDFSGSKTAIPVFEICAYAATLPSLIRLLPHTHKIKRAIVSNDSESDFRFFENVSVNRAQNLKVFPDASSAREWLLS